VDGPLTSDLINIINKAGSGRRAMLPMRLGIFIGSG
jgi:hypothetical protein